MSEIEKAFEAGYRAYRDAFDHYDDFEEIVEHSLKYRMAKYVAAQQSVNPTLLTLCPECGVEQIVTHLPTCAHYVAQSG